MHSIRFILNVTLQNIPPFVVNTHFSISRSVFGFFSVPTNVYPWVLLSILQFMMPNVSLVGHLSGLLVGIANACGSTSWLLLSPSQCSKIEDWPFIMKLSTTCSNFIVCPQQLPSQSSRQQLGLFKTIHEGGFGMLKVVWWVFSAGLQILGLYTPSR